MLPKNHEIGSLVVRKAQIVSLDQLGSGSAIGDLFVIIAWTSQKASKVHKLSVSKLAIVLI